MLRAVFIFLLSWVWDDDLCAVPRCIQILSSWKESSGFRCHWLNWLHLFWSKKGIFCYWMFPRYGHLSELKGPGLLVLCPWEKAHPFAVGVAPFWHGQTTLIFPLACRYESSHLPNLLRSGGTACSTSNSSNISYLVEISAGRGRGIALLGVVQLGWGWHMLCSTSDQHQRKTTEKKL